MTSPSFPTDVATHFRSPTVVLTRRDSDTGPEEREAGPSQTRAVTREELGEEKVGM